MTSTTVVSAQPIRCPHDSVPMLERVRHQLTVHACSWCRSLWLPAPSWKRLCKQTALPVTSATDASQLLSHPRRTCPACLGQRLLIRHAKTIEIDWCPSCGGVWLDHNEIQRLLGLPLLPAGRASGKIQDVTSKAGHAEDSLSIHAAGEIAGTGLELFAEIIGGLLSGW